jgi:hypothetical protein
MPGVQEGKLSEAGYMFTLPDLCREYRKVSCLRLAISSLYMNNSGGTTIEGKRQAYE